MTSSATEARELEHGERSLAEKTQGVLNIISLAICGIEVVYLVDLCSGNKLSNRAKAELEKYRAKQRAAKQFRLDAAHVVLEAMLIVEPLRG